MPSRLPIVMLVALGVLCCPFNCLYHQAVSAEYFLSESTSELGENTLAASHGEPNGAVQPIAPPRQEDESGCICRGAIFVEPPSVVPLDLALWYPLLENNIALPPMGELDAPGDFLATGGLCWRPPISGRALRALHSTFLF
jgi:hypothetical protein